MVFSRALYTTKKPDHLKEGLLKFLQNGPKTLDECIEAGGEALRETGFKGSSRSDQFRMRVYEKLHELKACGRITKDRSVKPHLFAASESA